MTTPEQTMDRSTQTPTPHRSPRRVRLAQRTPEIFSAMLALDDAVAQSGIERSLAELIRIRASQVNGCAYCLDMHTLDARSAGESEQRIYALSAWRETPFFSSRERAALALTEAVTLVHDGQVPDDVYAAAAAEFDEDELAGLLWLTVVINAWNRIGIATRLEPGHYTPA
jgi:AhpD family alkylhydroperoxidase